MSESRRVAIVRRQYEAFNGDEGLVREHFDPEGEWMAAREDPDAATHKGHEAIDRYFEQWSDMITDIRVEATEITETPDDRVFAWIVITGRGAASGAEVRMEQAQVWTFRGDIAVRVEEYFDRDEGLQAAGLAD